MLRGAYRVFSVGAIVWEFLKMLLILGTLKSLWVHKAALIGFVVPLVLGISIATGVNNWMVTGSISTAFAEEYFYEYYGDPLETAHTTVDLAILIISLFLMPWVAIGWHRHVLRGYPTGRYVAHTNGKGVWSYFWMSLLIGLISSLVLIPAVFLGSTMFIPLGDLESGFLILPMFLAGVGMTYVFGRLGMVLPAIALLDEISFHKSRKATRPLRLPIFLASCVAGVLLAFGMWIIDFLPWNDAICWLYEALFQLLWFVLGISFLTTIYTHADWTPEDPPLE